MEQKKSPQAEFPGHIVYGHRTRGQRLADDISAYAGSWGFIVIFFVIIFLWVAINVLILSERAWDPYPFILLNLGLSLLASIQAPVILMSQNRAAERDRRKAELDLRINRKAEQEIVQIQEDIRALRRMLEKKNGKTG